MKSQTNAAVDCLFGFTGRPTDNDTGLRNHLNRWTDPQTAGWLSKDPLGFMAGDTNTVRYVGNRVTSLTDPTGLQRWNSQEVVSLLDQISPTLGAFWQRYGKVVGGAQQRSTFGRMFHWFDAPSVKVTRWYDNGTYVNPAVYPGLAEEVTAKVPDDWTSIQVAMYIAGQVAGNQSLQGALASRCVSGFDLECKVLRTSRPTINNAVIRSPRS